MRRMRILACVALVGACSGSSKGGGSGGRGSGPGTGGAGQECRSSAESCAVTTDCCGSLICLGNICTLSQQGTGGTQGGTGGTGVPQCRAAAEACAVTTDCCSSLICLGNVCRTPTPGTGGAPAGSGGAPGTGGRIAGTGGAGPTCRTATQACAITADCCSSLICSSNVCTSPPMCRASNDACAVTADCCNPLVCLSNRCQPAPTAAVCGDGVCTGGETPATCCQDCGCPLGTTCTTGGCLTATVSTMEWVVTNSCFNGEDIELRFFDTTNRLVWPPEPGYVYVLPEGETRSQLLSCLTGSRICLGARQELHGFYWGVDINWSQSCAACCYTCSNVSVNFPPLVCL